MGGLGYHLIVDLVGDVAVDLADIWNVDALAVGSAVGGIEYNGPLRGVNLLYGSRIFPVATAVLVHLRDEILYSDGRGQAT